MGLAAPVVKMGDFGEDSEKSRCEVEYRWKRFRLGEGKGSLEWNQ